MKNFENLIMFENSAKMDIVKIFGYTIDSEGYIVDQKDYSVKIKNEQGDKIHIDEFAGVKNIDGKPVFFTNNLASLMDLKLVE